MKKLIKKSFNFMEIICFNLTKQKTSNTFSFKVTKYGAFNLLQFSSSIKN
jgi:hypothetical protein